MPIIGPVPVFDRFIDGRYALLRAEFHPHAVARRDGGQLVFSDLVGKAQVWVDGQLAGEKSEPLRGTLSVRLRPGDGERAVAVLIEASPGSRAGLGGRVIVE